MDFSAESSMGGLKAEVQHREFARADADADATAAHQAGLLGDLLVDLVPGWPNSE
ncbi:hypothetical protein [Roseateles sp. BYS96W]|uniref:Uncharacterized protein n=1 Tax=Pelomonas nitida TaxID=3299027 RepID=A0ABW7G6B3_9BURK